MKARAATQLAKAWAAELCAIETGRLLWRVASTWIDESDGTYCAEFTHVSSGKARIVRVPSEAHSTTETRRAAILRALTATNNDR